ncbi:hypothetical protein VPH35_097484 [Triticum aestivum]
MKSQSTAVAARVPTRAASTLACASAISRMDRRKSSYGATESVTTATPQPLPPETTFLAAIPATTSPPSLSEPPSSSCVDEPSSSSPSSSSSGTAVGPTLRDRKLTARAPSPSSSSRLPAATWRWRTPEEKELVRGCMHAESNEPAAAAAEGEGDGLSLALGRPWPWSFLRALGKWRNFLSLARFLLLFFFFLASSSIPSMFLLISWYVET